MKSGKSRRAEAECSEGNAGPVWDGEGPRGTWGGVSVCNSIHHYCGVVLPDVSAPELPAVRAEVQVPRASCSEFLIQWVWVRPEHVHFQPALF